MELREEIAARLLDRDEGGGLAHITWARTFILKCKDEDHQGDCSKAKHPAPYTCSRCVIDQVMADADAIIAVMQAARMPQQGAGGG